MEDTNQQTTTTTNNNKETVLNPTTASFNNQFKPNLKIIKSNFFKWEIIIKNSGSTARDHLANERTLLSWIRTSIIFITFGIGFLQFYRLESKSNCINISEPISQQNLNDLNSTSSLYDKNTVNLISKLSKPIAPICVIMGFLTFLFGIWRYLKCQIYLIEGLFPATRWFLIFLILINLALLILLLIINFKVIL
ncbi:uncharacterized protein KGF55_005510 [Candida pseudojiufengensis]|uniref:uncharacterized protein n=1 Tax=Candida pseudojiufengensis TaxID=497109 RepID=UPI0022252767|nr:uncharacterized protein KGF55_005510 [Candida pseudojiufengensis]KAI5959167.1 hypothetical protein KGF55_005510 [Candida pseudojiufengensis]